MEYKYFVLDPELDNVYVLDSYQDSDDLEDDEKKKFLALEYSTMKPFLDKYGLIVEFFDENDEKIDLSKELAACEGSWTEVDVLPTPEDIEQTYATWVKSYPWMRLDDFEGFPYPLCWQYSRPIRKKKMEEKLESN